VKEARASHLRRHQSVRHHLGREKNCATPIARKFERTQGVRVDPNARSPCAAGSTEAMMASMMGIINPGDEVVIFEPHYENYGPDAILSGATPRFVQLRPPGLEL